MAQNAEHVAVAGSAAQALWPLGLATALSLMGDATLYAVLPTHPVDAGIALGSVGLILSINRVIRLLSNGPAGWLFDRLPDRRTLFVGSLWLGVLSTAMYASSAGLPLLFLARLLWGLAWSGIWIGGNAIVLEMAPEDQRGRWVGIYQVWFFFGAALGSFLGGAFTDAVGYHHALGLGALISAGGTLAAMAALGNPRPGARGNPGAGGVPKKQEPAASIRRIRVSLPRWRAISPAMGAASAAHAANRLVVSGVVSATLGLVVEENLGAGLQWGAWQLGVASITGGFLAARTLVSLVGAPLAGIWSDSEGNRWRLLVWSLVASALGIGLLAAPGIVPVVAGTFVGAAASGSIQALATTLAGDLASDRRHAANLGILYTAGDLGSAIGPVAAYALLPLTGLPAVFVGCAILLLLVAAICAWVSRIVR